MKKNTPLSDLFRAFAEQHMASPYTVSPKKHDRTDHSNEKYQDLLANVKANNFETLAQKGHQGPIVLSAIKDDWSKLENQEQPDPEAVRETLLMAIAAWSGYVAQEVGRFIKDKPEYAQAMADGLKLGTLSNNSNGCLERLCSEGQPNTEQIEEALELESQTNHLENNPWSAKATLLKAKSQSIIGQEAYHTYTRAKWEIRDSKEAVLENIKKSYEEKMADPAFSWNDPAYS